MLALTQLRVSPPRRCQRDPSLTDRMPTQWSLLAIKSRSAGWLVMCGVITMQSTATDFSSAIFTSIHPTKNSRTKMFLFHYVTLMFILHLASCQGMFSIFSLRQHIIQLFLRGNSRETPFFHSIWSASPFILEYTMFSCLNVLTLIHIFVTTSEAFVVSWTIFPVSGN